MAAIAARIAGRPLDASAPGDIKTALSAYQDEKAAASLVATAFAMELSTALTFFSMAALSTEGGVSPQPARMRANPDRAVVQILRMQASMTENNEKYKGSPGQCR